jgi:hypothetical protein
MTKNYISIFSNLTEQELRNHMEGFTLSHSTNVNISDGDGILLVNKDRKYVFGVTRATSSAYIPTVAQNIYSDTKYNKWEIDVEPVVYFANPISYEDLRELIGASPNYKTNILNGFQEAFVSIGANGPAPDSADILRRLDTIVKMHV